MSAPKQLSNVCFTSYGREPAYDDRWMTYLVYQREKCPTTGREHWQGYMELKKLTNFNTVKSHFGDDAHLEPRKGTQDQAVDYCKKKESQVSPPKEFGTLKKQGKRNDLIALGEMARQGKRQREAYETMPAVYMRNFKAFDRVASLYKPPERPVTVTLLYGPPGVGKTRFVLDADPETWFVPLQKEMWFDGYDHHFSACLDDFSGQMPLPLLLRLLDRYVVKVPVKGSTTWWTPRNIYITSNYLPFQWYDYSERKTSLDALLRRITNTINLSSDQSLIVP